MSRHERLPALTKLRGRSALPTALVTLVAFLSPMFPARTARAGLEEAGPADSPNFADSTNANARAKDDASSSARKTKSRKAPVSAKGSFTHSVGIQVPPGRLGMTPSLALSYDSSSTTESAVGVGWSLGLPSISRSTRLGFPKVQGPDNARSYDEGAAIFTGPSGELVLADDGPGGAGNAYAPLRETSPVRYQRVGDWWVEHEPSGRKRWYGYEPYTETTARITNELGTAAWLLVREEDPYGNFIKYTYHREPDATRGSGRADKRSAQWMPVLKRIEWGGNRPLGQASSFFVQTTTSPQEGPVNLLEGNTRLEDRITKFDVGIDGAIAWSYTLGYTTSETGKALLTTVTRGGDAAETTTFGYSAGAPPGSRFVGMGPIAPSLGALYVDNATSLEVWRSIFQGVRPNEVLAAQAAGYRAGLKLIDVDGNGTTDAIYHAPGIGTTSTHVLWGFSYLQEPSATTLGAWVAPSVPVYDPFAPMAQPGTGLPYFPYNGDWTHPDFAGSMLHDLVDLDGDGDSDGVALALNLDVVPGKNVALATPPPHYDPMAAGQMRFRFTTNGARPGPVDHSTDQIVNNWPSGISVHSRVVASTTGEVGDLLRYKVEPQSDVQMPIVDLNADGRSDVVLLKANLPYVNWRPAGVGTAFTATHDSVIRTYRNALTLDAVENDSLEFEQEVRNLVRNDGAFVLVDEQLMLATTPPGTRDRVITSAARLGIVELPDNQPVVMFAMGGSLPGPPEGLPPPPKPKEKMPPLEGSPWWRLVVDPEGDVYDPLRDNYYLNGFTTGFSLLGGVYRYVPRVYTMSGETTRAITPEPTKNASHFERSLQRLLSNGSPNACLDLSCNYLPHVNFNTIFLDVNGDSLPDITIAREVAHLLDGDGTRRERCQEGHRIHLNRGYAFEEIERETFYHSWTNLADGASVLRRVANRDRMCESVRPLIDDEWNPVFSPNPDFPVGAMAPTDLDGDGRVDLVIAYQRNLNSAATEQLYFRNTGRGFAQMPNPLPSDVALARNVRFPSEYSVGVTGGSYWPRPGLSDTARFADLDNDGLVDILVAGSCRNVPPFNGPCTPAKWYRNAGELPDRLTSITSSSGEWTKAEYASPKQSDLVIPEGGIHPPATTRLLKKVRSASGPESAPLDFPVQEVRFSYENFVKDLVSNEVLGFEKVKAEFINSFNGANTESVIVTRTFDVRPDVLDGSGSVLGVRHPLKGALVSTTTESGGWTASDLMEFSAEPLRGGVRIRPKLELRGDTSPAGNTAWFAERTVSADAFGNPTEEISGNWDGAEISPDHARTVLTEYENRTTTEWHLGMVTRERNLGYSEDIAGVPDTAHLLGEVTKTYHPSSALRSSRRVGIRGGTCAGGNNDTDSYDVNGFGLVTLVRESTGREITTVYDAKKLYPASVSTQVERWLDGVPTGVFTTLTVSTLTDLRTGKQTSVTDPNASSFASTFDSAGRLLTKTGPDGTLLESHVYTNSYPLSVVSTITTDTGKTFQRKTQLDGDEHALSVVEGAGTTAVPWSRKSKTRFDAFGREVESFLPELVSTIDGGSAATAGPKETSTYDGFDRPTQTLLADGTTTSVAYEPRWTLETNARGISTHRIFDAFGSLLSVERNPGGAASETSLHSFVRDGRGEILQVIDGDGSVRRFERDGGGRLLYVTLPALPGNPVSQFSMCHDLGDGLVRLESAAGRVVDITRDQLGRVVKTRGEDLTGLVVQSTQDYDDPTAGVRAKARLRKKVDESGVYTLAYDTYGRPASVTFAPSVRAKAGATNVAASYKSDFVYSVAGLLKTATISTGLPKTAALVYTRDVKGRTTTIESKVAAASTVLAANLAYDADDRLTFARYGNNTTGNWTFNALSGRLDRVAYKTSANAVVAAVGYVYDPNGNPLEENREREGWGGVYSWKLHSYDALDRVLQSISSSPAGYLVDDHTFSPGGNLLTAGGDAYVYSAEATSQAATQVVNATAGSQRDLTYDLDGYLATDRHAPADGSVSARTLAFDPMGCMRSITRLDTGVLGGETTASSTYTCGLDGKVVARATTKLDGSTLRRIDFAGLGEIRPDEGAFVLRVPVGGTVAVEDARLLSTGDRSTALSGYVANDARGSVLANTGLTTQALSKEAEFDAWGKRLDDFTTMSSPRHGFAGAEADGAVGTYSFGARTYDPALRRWVSPDPLVITAPEVDEEAGDELNLFSYAGGNPVKKTDRSGYCGACEAIAAGAVFGAVAGALHHAITTPNLNPKDFALGTLQAASRGAWEGASQAAMVFVVEAAAAKHVTALVRATTSAETAAVKTATTAAKTEATAASNASTTKAASANAAAKPPATGSCFVAGTPVATPSGSQPIETLQVGDAVWTKDAAGGEPFIGLVTRSFERESPDTIDVSIRDTRHGDFVLTTTPEHPFWVAGRGWTGASDLQATDVLDSLHNGSASASTEQIHHVLRRDKNVKVYNLEVANGHSFFVGKGELWVHNTCGAKAPAAAPKQTGNYTNLHASGKTYDGKGGTARSNTSGARVAKAEGDPHVATTFTPAKNSREALKAESRSLDANGGPKSPTNYNKIESPGKKMRIDDGELPKPPSAPAKPSGKKT